MVATADPQANDDEVLIVTSAGDDIEVIGSLATPSDRLSALVV